MKESVQWEVICSGMMYVCGVRKQSAPETFKKMHDATKIVYIEEKKKHPKRRNGTKKSISNQ